ncbi:AraC family transcriptional regulator [Paenibacillus sp. N1-5-1-14]|uniref:AraC family transcriptional regulator n=1 Tax=Paenibacillus radicibacter TaxID=2972488 RepID=UPI0021595757|nr:AraC family transcriptional regulator [Paenibacillus radicibacter]MCR8645214.1 AraC family transcriptional regulator [Paenibacillus radicibacter]
MNMYDSSMLRAIVWMEERIDQEITLDEVAKQATFSKFHFTRLFKAVTKESFNDYVRKRRLTRATYALIDTKVSILQIAVDVGYASHEAFTRAFTTYMGLTPLRYRKQGMHHRNLYKEPLTSQWLHKIKFPVREEVQIVHKPETIIAGLHLTGEFDNNRISQLWNRFYDELFKLGINPDQVIGYGYESLDASNTPYYLAAIEVDSLEQYPDRWTCERIPSHQYAVFQLENKIESIPYAIEHIYKHLLPTHGLRPALHYSFEYYDKDFIANNIENCLQLYIPIE